MNALAPSTEAPTVARATSGSTSPRTDERRTAPRAPLRETLVATLSWAAAGWTGFVFLGSLPYKFTNHPDTRHIFTTIGDWLGGFLGGGIGTLFGRFGGYAIGSLELATSLVLIAPAALWAAGKLRGRRVGPSRGTLHAAGGLMAATLMGGAVFFHLASPLGVVVVGPGGEGDGGSLFVAASSIVVLGLALFTLNRKAR